MSKMTQQEIQATVIAAKAAVDADRRNDTVARDAALVEMFVSAGYWPISRKPTTAEFRGERVPQKMLRMPNGARSVAWSRRFDAAEAWAAE